MSTGPHDPQGPNLAAQASDPGTPLETLAWIAGEHPELRAAIAENPSTYPDLLTWLEALGQPDVDEALNRRYGRAPSAGTPAATHHDPHATQVMPQGIASQPAAEEFHPGDSQAEQDAVPQSGPAAAAAYPVAQQPYPQADPAYQAAPHWQGPPPTGNDRFFDEGEYEEEERKRRAWIPITILASIFAIGALVASFILLPGVFGTDEEEPTAAQEPAPDETAAPEEDPQDATVQEATPEEATPSPTEEEEDEEEDEEEELERPAPDNAVQGSSFSAPSGNIYCELSGDEVSCTILEYDFSAPSGCDDSTTMTVTREGSASPECDTSVGSQALSLDYGETITNDDFACTSDENGIECWSTLTGNGFTVARAGYDTFSG